MIRKFVKKPKYINAVQWTGDNTEEVQNFIGETCKIVEHTTFDNYYYMTGKKVTKILECKNPLPYKDEDEMCGLEAYDTIKCYVTDWVIFDNDENCYYTMSNMSMEKLYNDITDLYILYNKS